MLAWIRAHKDLELQLSTGRLEFAKKSWGRHNHILSFTAQPGQPVVVGMSLGVEKISFLIVTLQMVKMTYDLSLINIQTVYGPSFDHQFSIIKNSCWLKCPSIIHDSPPIDHQPPIHHRHPITTLHLPIPSIPALLGSPHIPAKKTHSFLSSEYDTSCGDAVVIALPTQLGLLTPCFRITDQNY